MGIGTVQVSGKAVLAPMAGVSDAPFRRLCRSYGAALVFTEMVSANGLVRGSARTWDYLRFADEERPIAVQLFGADPVVVAEAVQLVQQLRPELIDLNFGCPMPKVIRQGAGAALLKEPARMEAICRAAVGAATVPVTAKVRSGWHDGAQAVEIARRLADCGVAAITVHARTRSAMFTGKADWRVIAAVKAAVTVPVIGNGDVVDAYSARQMMEQTGCDLLMVGRGALGNPFVFRHINQLLAGQEPGLPSVEDRIAACLHHLELAAAQLPETVAVVRMRKHVAWYLKRIPGTKVVRSQVMALKTVAEVRDTLMGWLAQQEGRC
ncbi:MAG: tRNA dihydrouridine synthase DusB [bacterium]|jgi:nifR3 family TIM-barrel protein|nr:tRNA dihydrouridine synthase DusB [candidate division KSB1 bacterium]MDH7559179.1 tRNA dihydrouridine synthase DusB [bacterium]